MTLCVDPYLFLYTLFHSARVEKPAIYASTTSVHTKRELIHDKKCH